MPVSAQTPSDDEMLEKKAQTQAVRTEEVVDVVVHDGAAVARLKHDARAHPVDVAAVVDLAVLQADVEDGAGCVNHLGDIFCGADVDAASADIVDVQPAEAEPGDRALGDHAKAARVRHLHVLHRDVAALPIGAG